MNDMAFDTFDAGVAPGGLRSKNEIKILIGMESCVAPLTILKGHQTTSRETADHSVNSQKVP